MRYLNFDPRAAEKRATHTMPNGKRVTIQRAEGDIFVRVRELITGTEHTVRRDWLDAI